MSVLDTSGSDIDVVGFETAYPGPDAQVGGFETANPGRDAQVGGFETAYPGSEAQVNLPEPVYPGSEAQGVGFETAYPVSEAQIGGSEAAYRGSEAQIGGSEAAYRGSEAQIGGSEAQIGGSEAAYPGSEAQVVESETAQEPDRTEFSIEINLTTNNGLPVSASQVEELNGAVSSVVQEQVGSSEASSEAVRMNVRLSQPEFLVCKNKYIKTDDVMDTIYKLRFRTIHPPSVNHPNGRVGRLRANSYLREPSEIEFDVPTARIDGTGPRLEKKRRKIENRSMYDCETNNRPYDCEKILTMKEEGGRTQYYVKWTNYPMDECSWVKKENASLDELISDYELRQRTLAEMVKIYDFEVPAWVERPTSEEALTHYRTTSFLQLHNYERKIEFMCVKYNQAKLFVENWLDQNGKPPRFEFSLEHTYSEKAKAILEAFPKRTACSSCVNSKCSKSKKSVCCGPSKEREVPRPITYNSTGFPVHVMSSETFITAYECSSSCRCYGKACGKTLVQRGRRYPLMLFKVKEKGWGMFAMQQIPKGAFICEYIGHVYTTAEVHTRGRPKYAFDICKSYSDDDTECLTVDAEHHGNESRYVNHSCDPNIRVCRVYVDFDVPNYYRITYFAVKTIEIGEELTLDYFAGRNAKRTKNGKVKNPCLCKAAKCRGEFGVGPSKKK